MVSICGGGTSAPKAGTAAVAKYSAGVIAALMAVYDMAWLIPVVPLLSFTDEVLASLCSADPPAMPSFTAAEAEAMINLQLGADFDSGVAKLPDLILNLIWLDACECTSGTLAVPSAPAQPSGVPTSIYQLPGASGPCDSFHHVGGATVGPSLGFANWLSCYPLVLPKTYRILTTSSIYSAGGCTYQYTIHEVAAASVVATTASPIYPVAGTNVHVGTVTNPATDQILVDIVGIAGSGQSLVLDTLEIYCDPAPGDPLVPCCPPDVGTQALLDSILKMVTLIQRQTVPFAYVTGAVHSGLSGAGAIAISGVLGVKVAITADTSGKSVEGTSPPYHFDLGYLSFGTVDGFPNSFRLNRNPQIIMPPRASVYTDLDYDLVAGVTVTITELIREP